MSSKKSRGKLIYGLPTTGKSFLAKAKGFADTDTILGYKLKSTSTSAEKENASRAADTLVNQGQNVVTNLLDIKPSVGFVRKDASSIRRLMKARGDDASRVDALPIEDWLENTLVKFNTVWKDVPLIVLEDDHSFMMDYPVFYKTPNDIKDGK